MSESLQTALISQAWEELAGEATDSSPVPLVLTGDTGHLPSRFAVEETAVACVSLALTAGAQLQRHRGGTVESVFLDRGHVAAAVRSERFFRSGGQPGGAGFAPLSRFWPAADGWVRTHANYPWHRAALLSALGVAHDEVDVVGAAISAMGAHDVEERVFAAGGIAAAVRAADEWRAHPQGRALAEEPLIGHHMIGDAAPRTRRAGDLPASGVRVLDLTRVIAGPVCTRYLAALGGEVLRLDPPRHPDMAVGEVSDTLLGKRSALLELRAAEGTATLHQLLAHADVVVCGYRPGALDRFGLTEDVLASRHPGLVVIYLDAWGHRGPWLHRRGFDSVVQGPTGIAAGESADDGRPGTLPCQLLDHGTGYLAAAAALDGLHRQSVRGGTHIRRLSLARTAAWLTASGPVASGLAVSENGSRWLARIDSNAGPVTAVAPPGTLDDRPLQWPSKLHGYGIDLPTWSL